MNANNVFNDTVAYLSKYNRADLIEIAYAEFDLKFSDDATKEEIVNDCAMAEVHNFSI